MENKIKTAEEILYERWKEWMEMEFDRINLADLTFEEFKNETSWMFFIPAFEKYANQFKTSKFTQTPTDEKEIEDKYCEIQNRGFAKCDAQCWYCSTLHKCKYCKVMTNEPDEKCYKALQSRVVNVSDEEIEKILSDSNIIGEVNSKTYDTSLDIKIFRLGMNYRSKLSLQSEKEMDEFAVGFAEWTEKNMWTKWESRLDGIHEVGGWYNTHNYSAMKQPLTTQQLLTTYKESQLKNKG